MIWRTLGLRGTACLAAHRLMRCVTHKNPRSAAGSTVCVWVVSQRHGVSAYLALQDHRATPPPSQLPSSHRYCYTCNFFTLSEKVHKLCNRFSQPTAMRSNILFTVCETADLQTSLTESAVKFQLITLFCLWYVNKLIIFGPIQYQSDY